MIELSFVRFLKDRQQASDHPLSGGRVVTQVSKDSVKSGKINRITGKSQRLLNVIKFKQWIIKRNVIKLNLVSPSSAVLKPALAGLVSHLG